MTPLIEIRSVSFSYMPEHPVLNNICASIMPGQLITLLGPNGVGKSTLLNCISGLLSPSCGEVLLNGKKMEKLSRKHIARNIAYVPQKPTVSFDYSVLEFVVMGRTSHMKLFSMPELKDYQCAERALKQMDILDFKDRPISELSGGEQQKVCIVRALIQEPQLIILDEPTSALDYGNQVKVLKLIKQLAESGYAILITTHNPEHPLLLNSNVWILDRDGKLNVGSSKDMITESKLTALYETDVCIMDVGSAGRRACIVRSI